MPSRVEYSTQMCPLRVSSLLVYGFRSGHIIQLYFQLKFSQSSHTKGSYYYKTVNYKTFNTFIQNTYVLNISSSLSF